MCALVSGDSVPDHPFLRLERAATDGAEGRAQLFQHRSGHESAAATVGSGHVCVRPGELRAGPDAA